MDQDGNIWALPEALSTSLYEFSNKGDSGALVWTDKGDAVGIVIAGWTALFERPPVMAVVLPNGYWDTKNIAFSDMKMDLSISRDCLCSQFLVLSV